MECQTDHHQPSSMTSTVNQGHERLRNVRTDKYTHWGEKPGHQLRLESQNLKKHSHNFCFNNKNEQIKNKVKKTRNLTILREGANREWMCLRTTSDSQTTLKLVSAKVM